MSFNVGNYLKESSKTPIERIQNQIVSSSTNNLPNTTKLVADSIAASLTEVGLSYQTTETFTRSISDYTIGSSYKEFYDIAAGGTNNNVAAKRLTGIEQDVHAFMKQVVPSTKLADTNNDFEVIVSI